MSGGSELERDVRYSVKTRLPIRFLAIGCGTGDVGDSVGISLVRLEKKATRSDRPLFAVSHSRTVLRDALQRCLEPRK
jgi:hypothetical protein